MKVRMKTLMAGPDGIVRPGEIADVTSKVGKELLDTGQAESPDKKPPVEAAADPQLSQ